MEQRLWWFHAGRSFAEEYMHYTTAATKVSRSFTEENLAIHLWLLQGLNKAVC